MILYGILGTVAAPQLFCITPPRKWLGWSEAMYWTPFLIARTYLLQPHHSAASPPPCLLFARLQASGGVCRNCLPKCNLFSHWRHKFKQIDCFSACKTLNNPLVLIYPRPARGECVTQSWMCQVYMDTTHWVVHLGFWRAGKSLSCADGGWTGTLVAAPVSCHHLRLFATCGTWSAGLPVHSNPMAKPWMFCFLVWFNVDCFSISHNSGPSLCSTLHCL